MAFQAHSKNPQSGIALFMVIAAMTILSLIVTEFTYITQVNQRMAFDSLDQLKAFYLAKSGLKIQLLRLKAFQNVKDLFKTQGASPISKKILDKIWDFPFLYPFPSNLPGMTLGDKERIDKFQKESSLEGSLTALMTSESSKFNLNSILSSFAPKPKNSPSPNASSNPTQRTAFNPDEARKGLILFLNEILTQKFQSDPEFANDYRDFDPNELKDNLFQWADRTYEPSTSSNRKQIKPKKAPFYSLSELHMIYPMDDRLFDLFAPELTVNTTSGLNINTIKEASLKALLPQMTAEETQDFFKHRDSEEDDNQFKNEEDFFKYLQASVKAYQSEESIKELKKEFAERQIHIVTDESIFYINVRSQVNQATRILEAWVTLSPPQSSPSPQEASEKDGTIALPDTGLKINYMRTQ